MPASPLPKYHIVKEVILERISNGSWQPGALIPTEAELCREFKVSRITVRHTISDLVHEGKLRTVQGKGTFVATSRQQECFVQRSFSMYEDMERRGLHLTTNVLRQEIVPAQLEVAHRLKIRSNDPVHILVRLRSVNDEKILVSTTYIPIYLCPGLVNEDLSAGSLYQLLQSRYELKIARGVRSLGAIAAGPWEAHLLDIALSSPLLHLDSVAYLADGRAFEYSQVLQRGDRARIEMEFLPEPK